MVPKLRESVKGLRTAGNERFRTGQYAEASALYSRALQMLQAEGSSDPEEESVLYSNRAACHLKDGNIRDCIKDCTLALALVPFGIKPLLRRASAFEALEKYPLAYVDYKTVLQIDNSVTSALEGINRMTRALMDSLGPKWRLKLPSIPSVPVSAQKRWNSLPSENQKEIAKSTSKETTTTKNRVPSAGDVERAIVLKEEGNELVKKGNHKKAIEKYSESLFFSNLDSATYSNRALCYLVLKQYKEVVKDCTEALKLDGRNVKAFYRRAQAYKALKGCCSQHGCGQGLLSRDMHSRLLHLHMVSGTHPLTTMDGQDLKVLTLSAEHKASRKALEEGSRGQILDNQEGQSP